jgi:serine/threonine protein kinase
MTYHDQADVILDGKYRLECQLAEGGMGVLYRAADLVTGQAVAVKVLRSDKAAREEARARFALEARAVRALRHPHIVQVLASGEDARGTQYLVMELLEGVGLQEMLVLRKSVPVAEALTLLLPIASALSWAHDLGVLHRDVKPANIFLAKDESGFRVPKLLDFGMARVEGQARVTRTGHAVGTVGYMAPEQAIGREVSAQADVWSLGAVFFRCLAGAEPFDGPNEANVLLQIALARSRPLRSLEPSVPESVARVIERALERDQALRYTNVRTFIHALVMAAAQARVALAESVDSIGLPDYPRWRAEALRTAQAHSRDHVAPTQLSYARNDSRDFIGRVEVLEHLSEGVRKAVAGRGGAALILGEAGMGKTRVMQQLAMRSRELGAQVLRGFCEEGEGAPPYWPWVQMLRSLARETGQELDGMAPVSGLPKELRRVLEDNSSDSEQARVRHTQQERLRFFDDVVSFLERGARLRPLVLLLDDCHWADGASLALLNFLSRRVAQHPIYLLAARRTDANAEGDDAALSRALFECEQFRLTALSEDETRELCLRTSGTFLSEHRLRAITERSGGNPLFVKELARLYAEHSLTAETAIQLPAAIKDSIQRRLAQRSAECASMLECAAVLGATFELSSLVYVTDSPAGELLDLLDEARRAHLLVESQGARSRYRFTHALVQEVLYERLRSSRRVRIHHAAAEQLLMARGDDPEALPLIAHHAVRGAQLGHAGRAVDLAMSAGRQAVKQLAFEKALGWFGEALDTLELCEGIDRSERRVKILIAAGNAHYRGGQGARAREVYAKAAAIAEGSAFAELYAEAALGFAREGALHPTVDVPAVRMLEQALERLAPADSGTRARILARMAFLLYGNNDPDRVEALAREAARIADTVGDARTQVAAWIALSLAIGESARIQERLLLTERMVEVARSSADVELETHARAHRVCDLLRRGELSACESEIQHIEAAGQRVGHPLFVWSGQHARAALYMVRGEFDNAESTAIAARDLGHTFMRSGVSASFGAQVFPLYRLQGRLDELKVCVEHDFEMLSEVGQRGYKAALSIELGDLEGAREQLKWLTADDFVRAPRDWFRMPYWARVTELCWALDDRACAEVAYSELAPHAGQLFTIGSTACEGAIDRMLGMLSAVLGERARSAAEFERAIQLNTRLGAVPWLAVTQRAFARLLHTSDDEADHERARALEQSLAAIVVSHGLRGLARPSR